MCFVDHFKEVLHSGDIDIEKLIEELKKENPTIADQFKLTGYGSGDCSNLDKFTFRKTPFPNKEDRAESGLGSSLAPSEPPNLAVLSAGIISGFPFIWLIR